MELQRATSVPGPLSPGHLSPGSHSPGALSPSSGPGPSLATSPGPDPGYSAKQAAFNYNQLEGRFKQLQGKTSREEGRADPRAVLSSVAMQYQAHKDVGFHGGR